MSARIDHADKARTFLQRTLDALSTGDIPGSEAQPAIDMAQVHATLALVEQQRIANLIAIGQFRVGVNDLPHLRHLAVEPKGENGLQPVAEIREALGLS